MARLHSQTRRTLIMFSLLTLSLAGTTGAQSFQILAGDGNAIPMELGSTNMSSFSFGGSRLPSDTAGLLRMPQIIEELGLYEDQIQAVSKLRKQMQEQTRAIFKNVDMSDGDTAKIIQEAQRTLREKMAENLEELLLPKQLERMQQIRAQIAFRNKGALALLSGELAEQIDLTDAQQDKLKEANKRKQAELKKEIEALKVKYRNETFEEVLTRTQLKKLEQLSGDPYEVKKPDYRSMFQSRVNKKDAAESEGKDKAKAK